MFKKALVFILILFFTAALLPLWIMWRDFWVSRLDADTVRPANAAIVLSTHSYEGGRLKAKGRYNTVAGLLLAEAGDLPRAGDKIQAADWEFEVLSLQGRRIDKVMARPLMPQAIQSKSSG